MDLICCRKSSWAPSVVCVLHARERGEDRTRARETEEKREREERRERGREREDRGEEKREERGLFLLKPDATSPPPVQRRP